MRASERATQYVVTLLGAVAALPEELNLGDGREGRTDGRTDADGEEGEGEGEEALTALSNSHNIAAAAMTRTEQRGGRRIGSAGTR